jgi:hypothetical protein
MQSAIIQRRYADVETAFTMKAELTIALQKAGYAVKSSNVRQTVIGQGEWAVDMTIIFGAPRSKVDALRVIQETEAKVTSGYRTSEAEGGKKALGWIVAAGLGLVALGMFLRTRRGVGGLGQSPDLRRALEEQYRAAGVHYAEAARYREQALRARKSVTKRRLMAKAERLESKAERLAEGVRSQWRSASGF